MAGFGHGRDIVILWHLVYSSLVILFRNLDLEPFEWMSISIQTNCFVIFGWFIGQLWVVIITFKYLTDPWFNPKKIFSTLDILHFCVCKNICFFVNKLYIKTCKKVWYQCSFLFASNKNYIGHYLIIAGIQSRNQKGTFEWDLIKAFKLRPWRLLRRRSRKQYTTLLVYCGVPQNVLIVFFCGSSTAAP